MLAALLHQFPADIFELVPKPKAGDAWILPHLRLQQLASIGLFKSFDFGLIFRTVQFKIVDNNTWEEIIFDRYFPQKGQVREEGLQSFPRALYFQAWNSLLERVDEPRSQVIRNHVLEWFRTLWWLPFPESDRMWLAKRTPSTRSGWVMVPPGENRICPRLAVNRAYWTAEKNQSLSD